MMAEARIQYKNHKVSVIYLVTLDKSWSYSDLNWTQTSSQTSLNL